MAFELTDLHLDWTNKFTGLKITPPGLELKLNLTDSERKTVEDWLNQHFDAVLTAGKSPASPDSYVPAIDQNPSSIDNVVTALVPLTLAGLSKDGKDKLYRDTVSQLYDLARGRLGTLALSKSAAALKAMTQDAASKTLDQSAEAEAWINEYLRKGHLGPDIAGGNGTTVMFQNKTTNFDDAVKATVAAGQKADLKSGESGRTLITVDKVTEIARRILAAATPSAPGGSGGDDSKAQRISMYLQYTFTPDTVHQPVGGGAASHDQPAHSLTGQMTMEFHADNASGLEISTLGQLTWFADDKGGKIQQQSGFAGAQVAWVWSFLDGALQAGPFFQTLVGAARAGQTVSNKLEWQPTGQAAAGGQVQYAIPGLGGHVLVGVQAAGSATASQGADATHDATAGLTLTFKL